LLERLETFMSFTVFQRYALWKLFPNFSNKKNKRMKSVHDSIVALPWFTLPYGKATKGVELVLESASQNKVHLALDHPVARKVVLACTSPAFNSFTVKKVDDGFQLDQAAVALLVDHGFVLPSAFQLCNLEMVDHGFDPEMIELNLVHSFPGVVPVHVSIPIGLALEYVEETVPGVDQFKYSMNETWVMFLGVKMEPQAFFTAHLDDEMASKILVLYLAEKVAGKQWCSTCKHRLAPEYLEQEPAS